MSSDKTRILIVDDHPIIRQALAARIATETNWEVCGEAGGADEALELVRWHTPHLVLLDISLSQGHGIELLKQLKAKHSQIKVLVVSAYDEAIYAERALRAGAMGYFHKQEAQGSLLDAMRTVLNGQRYLSPGLTKQLLQTTSGASVDKTDVASLSDRELEIFCMIGQGLKPTAIGGKLFISPNTVETYRDKIRQKLGLKSAAELAQRAVQWVLENGP